MTQTLLQAIRDQMLDEDEPLAGLLRKCLLLGAETGSDSLRDWARSELTGYSGETEVPGYRLLEGIPILMDEISGNRTMTGRTIHRLELPRGALEYVPESVPFRQPIDELDKLATQKSLSFATPGLAVAMSMWNGQLDGFQQVTGLCYRLAGSSIAGILGKIRTQLVDLIADLTSDTPLSELPRKDAVDSAVDHRIGQLGDIYNTTIQKAVGPTAIGREATADGNSLEDAIRMLRTVTDLTKAAEVAGRDELVKEVDETIAALTGPSADTGDIVKRAGRLRALGEKAGVASIAAATGSASHVLTQLAVGGSFG